MSTRSSIIRKNKDNSYDVIYCHSDGYLTYNGLMLNLYYGKDNEYQRNKLFELGGLSILKKYVDPTTSNHSFDYDKREKDVSVFYIRDRGEEESYNKARHFENYDKLLSYMQNSWSEYNYLYDEEKQEWLFKEPDNKELKFISVYEGLYKQLMDIGTSLYKDYHKNSKDRNKILFKEDDNEKIYSSTEYQRLMVYCLNEFIYNGYLTDDVINKLENAFTTEINGNHYYYYNLDKTKKAQYYDFNEFMNIYKSIIDESLSSDKFKEVNENFSEDDLLEAKIIREKIKENILESYHLDFGFDMKETKIRETQQYKDLWKEHNVFNKEVAKNLPRQFSGVFDIIATNNPEVRDKINALTNYSGYAFESNGYYKLYVPSEATNFNLLNINELKSLSKDSIIGLTQYITSFSYNEDYTTTKEPSIRELSMVENGEIKFSYNEYGLGSYYSVYPYKKDIIPEEYYNVFAYMNNLSQILDLEKAMKEGSEIEYESSKEELHNIKLASYTDKYNQILINLRKNGLNGNASYKIIESYTNSEKINSYDDLRYITSFVNVKELRKDVPITDYRYSIQRDLHSENENDYSIKNDGENYIYTYSRTQDKRKRIVSEESLLDPDKKVFKAIKSMTDHTYLDGDFYKLPDESYISVNYSGYNVITKYSSEKKEWIVQQIYKENPKSNRYIIEYNSMPFKDVVKELSKAEKITNNDYSSLSFDNRYEFKKGDIKVLNGALFFVRSIQELHFEKNTYFYPEINYYKMPVEEGKKVSYGSLTKEYFESKNVDFDKVEEISYNDFANVLKPTQIDYFSRAFTYDSLSDDKIVGNYYYFMTRDKINDKLSLSDKLNKMITAYYFDLKNKDYDSKNKQQLDYIAIVRTIVYNKDKIIKDLGSEKEYNDKIRILVERDPLWNNHATLEQLQELYNFYGTTSEIEETKINVIEENSYYSDDSIIKDVINPDLKFDESLFVLDNNKIIYTLFDEMHDQLLYNIIDGKTLEKEYLYDESISIGKDIELTYGNIKQYIDEIINPMGNVKVIEINKNDLEDFMDSVSLAGEKHKYMVNANVVAFTEEAEIYAKQVSIDEFNKLKGKIESKEFKLQDRKIFYTIDFKSDKPYKIIDNINNNDVKEYEFKYLNSLKKYTNTDLKIDEIIKDDLENKEQKYNDFVKALNILTKEYMSVKLTDDEYSKVINIKNNNKNNEIKEVSDLISVYEEKGCLGVIELDSNSDVINWQNTSDQGFWYDELGNLKDVYEDDRSPISCDVIEKIFIDEEHFITIINQNTNELASYNSIPLEEAVLNLKYIYKNNEKGLPEEYKYYGFDSIDFSDYNNDEFELDNPNIDSSEINLEYLKLKDLDLAMTDRLKDVIEYALDEKIINNNQYDYLYDELVNVYYGSSTIFKLNEFLNNNEYINSPAPMMYIDDIDLSNIEKLVKDGKINLYYIENTAFKPIDINSFKDDLEEKLSYYYDDYSYRKLHKTRQDLYNENTSLIYDLQTLDPNLPKDYEIEFPEYKILISKNKYNYYDFNSLKYPEKADKEPYNKFLKDNNFYESFIYEAQFIFEKENEYQSVEDVMDGWSKEDYEEILDKVALEIIKKYDQNEYNKARKVLEDFRYNFLPLENVEETDKENDFGNYYYIAVEPSDYAYSDNSYEVSDNIKQVSWNSFMDKLQLVIKNNKNIYAETSEEEYFDEEQERSYYNFNKEDIQKILSSHFNYTDYDYDYIDCDNWHFIVSKHKIEKDEVFDFSNMQEMTIVSKYDNEYIFTLMHLSDNARGFYLDSFDINGEEIDYGGLKVCVGMEYYYNLENSENPFVRGTINEAIKLIGLNPENIVEIIKDDYENVIERYKKLENEKDNYSSNEKSNAENEVVSIKEMYKNSDCAGWIFYSGDESKCVGNNSNDLGIGNELPLDDEADFSDKMIVEKKIKIENGKYIYVGKWADELTIDDVSFGEIKSMNECIKDIKASWKITDSMIEVLENLNMNNEKFVDKSSYYDDLSSNEFKNQYGSFKELRNSNDVIEYFYDNKTDSIVVETWKGNIIFHCSKENIEEFGEQLYYKLSENPLFNETEYQKEKDNISMNNNLANNKNEELIYSNINEEEDLSNKEKYVLISKNSYKIAGMIIDSGILGISQEIFSNHTQKDIAYDIELGNTDLYLNRIKDLYQFKSQFVPSYLQELNYMEKVLNNVASIKFNGNADYNYDYKKLTSNQIKILLANELDKIDLDNPDNLKNFTKFISGYKNINNFSLSNKLLIFVQEYERLGEDLFNSKNPMIYKSFDEWKLINGGAVKKNQHALISVVPQEKKETTYFTEEEGNVVNVLPKTISKEEIKEREELVKEGKLMKKESTTTTYTKMPKYFRIDQTTLGYNKKAEIVVDYKKYRDYDSKQQLLEKLNLLSNDLQISTDYTLSMKNANQLLSSEAKAINDNNFENYTNNVDVKIAMDLYNINNNLLHKFMIKLPKEEQLTLKEMEIQTDLTTRISLEKFGINSNVMEKVYSLSGYDKLHNLDHEKINYNQVPKDMIISNLEISDELNNRLFAVLEQDKNKELLTKYIPDQLKKNSKGNYYVKNNGYRNTLKEISNKDKKQQEKSYEKEL